MIMNIGGNNIRKICNWIINLERNIQSIVGDEMRKKISISKKNGMKGEEK